MFGMECKTSYPTIKSKSPGSSHSIVKLLPALSALSSTLTRKFLGAGIVSGSLSI